MFHFAQIFKVLCFSIVWKIWKRFYFSLWPRVAEPKSTELTVTVFQGSSPVCWYFGARGRSGSRRSVAGEVLHSQLVNWSTIIYSWQPTDQQLFILCWGRHCRRYKQVYKLLDQYMNMHSLAVLCMTRWCYERKESPKATGRRVTPTMVQLVTSYMHNGGHITYRHLAISVCVNTLYNVCTMTKSPDKVFLRM